MTTSADRPPPWEAVAPTGPVLRMRDAAAYLGLSIASYYTEAQSGRVPSPVKIGERAAGVPRPWLDSVIAHRVAAAAGAL